MRPHTRLLSEGLWGRKNDLRVSLFRAEREGGEGGGEGEGITPYSELSVWILYKSNCLSSFFYTIRLRRRIVFTISSRVRFCSRVCSSNVEIIRRCTARWSSFDVYESPVRNTRFRGVKRARVNFEVKIQVKIQVKILTKTRRSGGSRASWLSFVRFFGSSYGERTNVTVFRSIADGRAELLNKFLAFDCNSHFRDCGT